MPCTFRFGKTLVATTAPGPRLVGEATELDPSVATLAATVVAFVIGFWGEGAGGLVDGGVTVVSRATARGNESRRELAVLRDQPRANRNAATKTMRTSAAQTKTTGSGKPEEVGGGGMVRKPPAGAPGTGKGGGPPGKGGWSGASPARFKASLIWLICFLQVGQWLPPPAGT